jgi:hypothetical protein
MGELDGSSQAQMAAHELAHFCTDGNQIYKIAVVQRSQQKEMVAFDEANRDGTLDDLLDKQLQDAYVEVRKKDPSAFQQEDGSWKPFGNVKDAVAAKVYADLLKSIENEARAAGKEVDGKPSYAFYAHHRLLPYLSEARNHLAIEQDDQMYVNTITEVSPLADEDSLGAQWKLTKIHRDVNRGEASQELKQALFTDQLNGWSAVGAESDGHLMFFKVLERKQHTEPDANQISWGHQALSIDAQRALTQQLLDQIQTKKAIF